MKKTILSLISLSLVFVMLFAFASCGSSKKYDGTYYLYYDSREECDDDEWIKLEDSKWSMLIENDTFSGTYKISGEKITFRYVLNESDDVYEWMARRLGVTEGEVTLFEGTIKDGKITLTTWVGEEYDVEDADVFYLNGEVK